MQCSNIFTPVYSKHVCHLHISIYIIIDSGHLIEFQITYIRRESRLFLSFTLLFANIKFKRLNGRFIIWRKSIHAVYRIGEKRMNRYSFYGMTLELIVVLLLFFLLLAAIVFYGIRCGKGRK
jgi:hypothetical protein